MTWQISRKFDDLLWNDPRLINNKHLLSIGATVADTFCLRKCDCVLFTSPSFMEDNFLPNSKMKKSKTCVITSKFGKETLWKMETNLVE